MTLLGHLARTDLRQFRWPILLWIVLVVAETILIASRPALGADARLYANAGMLLGLLWWASQIGMLLLVPLIVHEHAAVGTDAFWMTRPMPAPVVFASKVLLLGVVTVLLLCAVRLALMLWIGVPAGAALFVTLDTAIANTAWLAVLMAGAALTLNLSRFALLCGAVIAAFVLLATLLIMRVQMDAAADTVNVGMAASSPRAAPAPDDPTQGVLFILAVAAAGFALVAIQYRTRRRILSVPVAIGGLALAVVAIPYWPIPILRVQSVLPAWTGQPGALELRAPSPVIELAYERAWFGTPGPLRTGTAPVALSGLEPGWVPRLELLGATLALDNGTTLASHGRGYQSTPLLDGSADAPWRAAARAVLGVEQVFGMQGSSSDWAVMLALPATELGGTAEARGHYRGDFAVRLAHWESVAALPLRAGAVFQDDTYKFALEQVSAGSGNTISLRAREWRATSSFDRKPMITYAFYVRNAQRSRAIEGHHAEPSGGIGHFAVGLPFAFSAGGPSHFFLRTAIVTFPPPYGPQEQKIDWDPAWYPDAELVLVRITEQGAVVRTVEVPGATLVAKK
jgi:hypothetical protein